MTATDELHRLLDERGAEWDGCILMGAPITFWGEQERDGRWPYRYWEHDGWASFSADPKSELFTPEQAIAATLGESSRLPYWWTHDGVLHIELPKLPESISVRLPDQRDREVGSARVWQYTRDSGTCHDVWDTELTGRLRFQCSECGAVSLEITPNFCPVCGRRVEVDA